MLRIKNSRVCVCVCVYERRAKIYTISQFTINLQ